MKAFVFKQSAGSYDDYTETVVGVYLVPDDFDPESIPALRDEWLNLWRPKINTTGRYKGKMSVQKHPPCSFNEWLAQKFESLPIVEYME